MSENSPSGTGLTLTVAEVHEAIAASRPDAECLIHGDRRLTWSQVTERTRRLANALAARGLGCRVERSGLNNWESGQDHLAIYLHNGVEYMESMLGAFKARVAPMNVNYRYVAEELRYLLLDSRAAAVVVHSRFTPVLDEVRDQLPDLRVILQVPDSSGLGLMDGAEWYEDVLAAASPERPDLEWSGDDLYILYTGGTTGMPKGVLWRNADALAECFGGNAAAGSAADYVAAADGSLRALLAPPFMHGAAHWIAFRCWNGGGTVVVPTVVERLDADDVWSVVEREKCNFLLIVGDAFARPLLDELDRSSRDLSSLGMILSGGAALSAPLKHEFMNHVPQALIIDGLGSSEAGGQLAHVSAGGTASTGTFPLTPGNAVLSAALDRVVEPGEDELGWLCKTGNLALGYLGDEDKTARTYPVVNGVRYAVPGDRARLTADGMVELHGRDSVTINSGGEKIFAEEVEAAIKRHPAVYDCVVAGRPSQRWGNEVVAVVRLRDGRAATADEIVTVAAGHIARYKCPKDVIFVPEIVRSPSGKADYRWAREIATNASRGAGAADGESWNRDDLPVGEEKQRMVREMFDAIAPRYDLVNRIMTFRLDVRWRRRAVRDLRLPAGSVVLDLAGGTGDLSVDLARAGLTPLSFDLSMGMLVNDRSGAPRAQCDIIEMPVADGAVDGVICGFALRNLVDLDAFFAEVARVLRPGGRVSLLDVGVPHNPVIRAGNNVYFGKVVPRIGALLSNGPAYRYLPKSVAYLPPREELLDKLRRAGFPDAEHHQLSGGLTQLMVGTRSR